MESYLARATDIAMPYLQRLAHTTPRQRIVTISAALSAVWLLRVLDRLMRPPPALRGLPRVGAINIVSLLTGGIEKTAYRLTLPAAQKHKLGMYVCLDITGWSVHIAKPEVAKQFLRNTDITKGTLFQDLTHGTIVGIFLGGPNIGIVNDEVWKKQRMIANPAFHRSMPLDLFAELSFKSFELIEQAENHTLDFDSLMSRFTLDVIGRAGFGFDFNALGDETNDWVRKYRTVNEALSDMTLGTIPFVDRNFYWLIPSRARARRDLTDLLTMMQGVIDAKRKQLGKQSGIKEREKDLLTLMLEAETEARSAMSDDELLANLCFFFVAGHDTTASALTYAIYWLACHPDIQTRAREEAQRVLGTATDKAPTPEQIKAMPYINRIIHESLRINPPATFTLPRFAARDTELGGILIPKGTCVRVDIFEMQRNPDLWKDPEVFNPDREETEGWLPFSGGPRQCLGMNFSLQEQRVFLPLLLQRYRWHLPENSIHRDGLQLKGSFLLKPDQLGVVFERVN